MKWRQYCEKLRQWEAEGYDVSELKQKWFPEGDGGGRSRTRIVLSVVVVAIVVVGGLLIWQHSSSGPPEDETVATLSTSIVPSVGGSVSPSSGTYDVGQEVILTASPASGYQFSHWDGDVGGSENPITIDIREDVIVTANFAKVSYSLSLSASPSEGGSVTPTSGTYDAGGIVDIVAEAEDGYRFVNWTGDVDTMANTNAASTSITMDGEYSIMANFEEKLPGQYDLAINSTEGGSVTEPGEGTFTHEEGERVTLTASPASGYRFSHWSGDATGTSPTTTVTLNSHMNVTANFVAIGYTLSTSVGPSGGGSVSPTPGYTYEPGSVVYPHARPDSGYTFDYWGGDASGHTNTVSVTMDSNKHIVAYFKKVAPGELYYDDASTMSGSAFSYAGTKRAIRFTPPSYPVELNTARVYLTRGLDQVEHAQFAIEVYDDDGIAGEPGTMLGKVYHTPTDWGWSDVDLSGLGITVSNGDFYIAYYQLKGSPEAATLRYDTSPPHNRSWRWLYDFEKRVWEWSLDTYDNYMIRCIVDY